jgi:hypothetical protein
VLELRRLTAAALARWVQGGVASLLTHSVQLAAKAEYATPILLAARLLLMAPEAGPARLGLLHQAYGQCDVERSPAAKAMMAVAIGSLAQGRGELLGPLVSGNQTPQARACLAILAKAGPWNVEDRPDLVLIVLALAFGREMAERWIDGQADPRGEEIMAGLFGTPCRSDAKFHKMVAKAYARIEGERTHATN